MKKKIFTLIMGLLLTALGAAAQNNGNAGPLTWNYNAGTKTLTITGTGEMPDYAYGGGTDRPWQTFKDEIETVTIGHGVTTVGQSAFTRCSKLQSITLPASLTKIGDHGFSRCTALQSIALPAALSEIGDYAFNGCTALTAFEVDPGNARYTATDGVLYNKAKTSLRKYPAGKAATSFSVPAGVTYIGEYAFEAAAKLQSITLPAGVERIGEHAFHGCTTLQSIALPEGLTTIGKYAFHNCTALQSITLPASLTHIRNDAFSRCTALESITLPAALTDIDGSAFFNCTALTAIGVDAGNARFTSADGVLYNKAKTELVRYPAGKPGTAFTVPAEVKKIGNDAFGNCKLQSITLPAGLTTIGRKAFLSCTALQSIAIPASVTSIEDYAFEDCTALTEVTVAWDTPLAIPAYVFHHVTLSNVTLRVPAGKMPAYQAEAVWKNFGTITDGVLFFLAVSPATLSFVAAGETKPVTVTASGAWTAASDQSWLTLSTGNGTGNTTISVTAANYTGTAPRTAKVTFTSSSITQEVNVTQQGASAPPALAVSPATLSFVAAGETKPVTVTASGAWTAASDQPWLTISTGSGTGNTTVNVTAANYTGTTPRTAKVTFTAGSVTQEVNVTQQAGNINMSRYITLTVQSGQPIQLAFRAAAAGTPVRVVSGSNTTDVTVNATGSHWSPDQNFTSDGTTMTVYGDITGFGCSGNGANLTALDVSHNTQLEDLYCKNNDLTALDVSACNQLKVLDCSVNQLTALDVSHNTQLKGLYCSDNQLTALDVSHNTQLEDLYCQNNDLTALDVSACTQLDWLECDNNRIPALDLSHNTQLEGLGCSGNQLKALDVSACTQLKKRLNCFNNNFSKAALNRLYCSLPDRTSTTEGKIRPAYDATDAGHADVLASSGFIATGKNWKVQYYSGGSDIPTTGTKTCGPDFAVTPETVDITFAGETKPLTVAASEAWTARCDAPWITLSAASGTGDGTITVTAPAYADEWPRAAKIFFVSGALKDTVTVTQHPKPGPKFLALDYTELTLPVGASQRLVVTAYPKHADINRGVKWYSLNDDIATVSANGTVTALKPGRTEITVVANVGGQQTTCRVRVVPAEQMVTVTSGSDNTLRIALTAPSDADFTLSFDVDLPEGFALDAKKTAPDASLADGYTVTVTGNRVEMKPGGLRAGGTMEKRDLLTLACKAVPGTSNGSYKGALRNLSFTPTAGYALQNVTVPFTFTYTVGNQTVDGLRVYAHGGALHLTLPTAQTVHIYHVDGAMVKTLFLPAGDHVQPLADGMYLVRVGEQVRKILVK